MAFAAQYAHPIEHIVANQLPLILPLAIRRSHILTFCIWLGFSLVETAAVHSGYDFFRPPLQADSHDLHHEKFNVHFGGLGILDWLHGTDRLDWNAGKKEKKNE
jgi:sterol desaturase/sphingolipid hydroxylase (fatty acid hydroxylase superfamily)